MTRSHRPRIAAGLILAIGALGIWLLFSQDRAIAPGAPSGAEAAGGAAAAGQLPGGSGAALDGEEVRRSEAPGSAGGVAEDGSSEHGLPVHLRVLLRVLDAEGEERIPERCAGWIVRAQSWIEETGVVIAHEAVADARGIAEFRFPGFVHVDWVGCSPPRASGFGFSKLSQHDDFDGGDEAEWTLLLEQRGEVKGRVLTMDDRPVAGAEVHAHDSSWPSGFEDWTPGFLITRTGADGGFHFDALGAGEWILAVAPEEYLQLDPMLGDAGEGKGWAEVSAGEVADAGVLRVIAAAEQVIRVVDADGAGMPRVMFALTASSFLSPGVRATAYEIGPEEIDEAAGLMKRFLAGENPEDWSDPVPVPDESEAPGEIDWPYDGLARETGADGRARWLLPPGRYAVECWSTVPGMPEGTIAPFEITVPGAPVEIRVPMRHSGWGGSIVDEEGAPVPNASVILTWQSESGAGWEASAEADAEGRFRFAEVPQLRECKMLITSGGHLDTYWDVSLLDAPAAPFCLPSGSSLSVLFEGPEGEELSVAGTPVQLRALRSELPRVFAGSIAGDSLAVGGIQHVFQNRMQAYQIASGEYELSLILTHFQPVQSFSSGPYWTSRSQMAESVHLGSWRVETGPGWTVLRLTPEQFALLMPQVTPRAGVVLDAESGLPIHGATVTASGLNLRHSASTAADGRFVMELAGEEFHLQIEAQGYAELSVDGAKLGGSGTEPEFRLSSLGALVYLRLLDRDGRRLPPCMAEIKFPGDAGVLSGLELFAGEATFYSRAAGTHRVSLEFAPGVRADASFELQQASGSVAVDCRIAWSLEELRAALRAAAR